MSEEQGIDLTNCTDAEYIEFFADLQHWLGFMKKHSRIDIDENANLVLHLKTGNWYISDHDGNIMKLHENTVYIGKIQIPNDDTDRLLRSLKSHIDKESQ